LLSIKRKALALTVISVFILLSVETFTSSANANPGPLPIPELPTPIYIRENGTIEGDAEAIQQNGNVYTFVRDINETIEIQKDNIVIDGNGFSLTKPPDVETDDLLTPSGWFPSIHISNRSNIIIKNIRFNKCYTGISVEHSSNIIIIQNTIENGNEGIYISSSINCSIIGNKLIDNLHQGLDINGRFFNIAYNTISRNQRHGGWLTVSYSNISRNDVTDNFFDNRGIGLYLYGNNSYNRIFENNFINNEVGLAYSATTGGSVNNTVYNNYWSNYQAAIQQSNAADATSQVDQSPLSHPISTSFDPSLFPLPSLTPDVSPAPDGQSDVEPFPVVPVAAASVATVVVVSVGLLVYLKKRKK
jgi:parallel beta-helix repeat protein